MPDDRPAGEQSAGRRILWFIGLWCAGVAAVGALAYAIRFAIGT
ncbi:DUF2474 family protein [Hwanghaeella grinnelliae]|uniref:DUF2474 family protein n=1 Tax=Hwanghaeella grinnelliae TaxID=2500179 RepID=A0A3S2VS10_9PROT|nr:DUF2474 family protein [Hwanghaeella grinnelliae]